MLVLLTIFLFHHNAGAYAGFLFLCELISLFTIFIILNKIRCDEFIVVKKNNQLIVFVYAIVIISLFSFFKKFLNYYIPAIIPMYSLFGIGTNDFIAINYLFYTNKYNIYLCICAFLIVYSSYVILYFLYVIDLYKTGNGPTFFKNYAISSSIGRVFSENNTLYFKNKISINYFKKLCLKI